MEGTRVNVGLLLQSISGFSDEVQISIPDVIEGLRLSLSETDVIPTSTVILTIDIDEGPGPFFIRVVATGGNLTREDILRLDTIPQGGSVTLIPPPGLLQLSEQDGTYQVRFNITLVPGTPPITLAPIMIEGLPDGFEASISPAGLRTLPYTLNMTVDIRTLENPEGPFNFTINVTIEGSSGHFREEITVLPYEREGPENGKGIPLAYVLVLFAAVGIISGVIVLLLASRRLSDHERGVGDKGAPKASIKGDLNAPSLERPHGSGRGPDRMVRKR